jgi:hypothetical protein
VNLDKVARRNRRERRVGRDVSLGERLRVLARDARIALQRQAYRAGRCVSRVIVRRRSRLRRGSGLVAGVIGDPDEDGATITSTPTAIPRKSARTFRPAPEPLSCCCWYLELVAG